jgi:aspartate/methionine/tyrosine aminotransferase
LRSRVLSSVSSASSVVESMNADVLAWHLLKRYSTLVVPGRFSESPRHIRISFGLKPRLFARGLANISRALDDLS